MDSLAGFFIDSAWAQDGAANAPSAIGTMLPLIVIFVLFYFLMIRPTTKKQKEHRAMVEALEPGNEVVTGGGVLGKITEVGEQFVTVEISGGVTIKVQRHTITAIVPEGTVKSA